MLRFVKNQDKDLIRNRFAVKARMDNNLIRVGKKLLLNFCSNDYLSIASHPALKKAFIRGIQQYGTGSGASALVSGYYRSHQILEEKFAEFMERDRAILFNSGYHANLGTIVALAHRQSKIFADKLCHASILDSIRLSRAKCIRYLHNDVAHLEALMNSTTLKSKDSLLITEGIFSMEGDICPLDQLQKIAQKYQSLLILDDAHGIGVLGKHGRGTTEHYHLDQQHIPILVLPLGKAFAGMGAVVTGKHDLIEHLIQFSRTYRYSTALPPAIAAAGIASLQIIEKENWRRHTLQSLIEFFIQQGKKFPLEFASDHLSPIKSILIGDNQTSVQIKEALMKHGFYVSCIRPPTVAPGKACIRISINCTHRESDLVDLLDLIATYHAKFK